MVIHKIWYVNIQRIYAICNTPPPSQAQGSNADINLSLESKSKKHPRGRALVKMSTI